MKPLTVALISGGDSSERQVSIDSGNEVFDALDKGKYQILRYDPKTDLGKLTLDAPQIDAALIILHGPFGEDGTLQGMLDLLDIPYQGSGVLGSALSMNKLASKQMYEKNGLLSPPYLAILKGDTVNPEWCVERLGLPLVVKPAVGGSSIGMSIARSAQDLPAAVEKAFEHDRCTLIETYLSGTELTCSVIGNDQLETYPLVEIRPGEASEFFDYLAKYTPGASVEICPAEVADDIALEAQSIAKKAHIALFCRGYSRTDFILSNGLLYVIETNTIPGMTRTSLLPKSAAAAGLSFSELLDRLIYLSLDDHVKKSNIRDLNRLERIRQALPNFKICKRRFL